MYISLLLQLEMILMTCWQLCSFIYNNKSSDLMLGLIRETVRA